MVQYCRSTATNVPATIQLSAGGKDSTVLAHVLSLLNERHAYGVTLLLLSIDEGISGYRDDSLETVKRNEVQLFLQTTPPTHEKNTDEKCLNLSATAHGHHDSDTPWTTDSCLSIGTGQLTSAVGSHGVRARLSQEPASQLKPPICLVLINVG